MKSILKTAALALTLTSSSAFASLIAQYTFDNGITDSSGSATVYDLAVQGGQPDLSLGAFWSDNNASNHLSVTGPGAAADWTVSLWVNTADVNQGTWNGIFSNNNNTGDFTWQLDSFNGSYRLASNGGMRVLGAVQANTWQHIFVQKFNGNRVRTFLDGQLIATDNFNPGGLQNFRVGTNRNTDNGFTGFIDNIQIYSNSNVEATSLYRQGPGANAVSSPSSLGMLGLSVMGVAALARRKKRGC